MTRDLKEAVDELGAKLRGWPWGLYEGTIRCSVAKLRLCPVGVAAAQASTELIEEVIAQAPSEDFGNAIRHETERLAKAIGREHPQATPAAVLNQALAYAAGAAVHKKPGSHEASALTGIDASTASAISEAADNPVSEVGQALVCALASEQNTLEAEYERSYGARANPAARTMDDTPERNN